jgi:hypothetical protein
MEPKRRGVCLPLVTLAERELSRMDLTYKPWGTYDVMVILIFGPSILSVSLFSGNPVPGI